MITTKQNSEAIRLKRRYFNTGTTLFIWNCVRFRKTLLHDTPQKQDDTFRCRKLLPTMTSSYIWISSHIIELLRYAGSNFICMYDNCVANRLPWISLKIMTFDIFTAGIIELVLTTLCFVPGWQRSDEPAALFLKVPWICSLRVFRKVWTYSVFPI